MSDELSISYGGGRLLVDEPRHAAELDGIRVALTPTEWTLLVFISRTPGRVVPRHELAELVFGRDSPNDERSIDAHMKNLRGKLADRGGEVIEVVHGVGFRLRLGADHPDEPDLRRR